MNKFCILLDSDNFCTGNSVFQEVPAGWIEIKKALYPNTIGQKFDPLNMCWLDEYAEWYRKPVQPTPKPTVEDLAEMLSDLELSLIEGGVI